MIIRIRDEAKSKNFLTEYQLCEKYLSLTQNKQKDPQKPNLNNESI